MKKEFIKRGTETNYNIYASILHNPSRLRTIEHTPFLVRREFIWGIPVRGLRLLKVRVDKPRYFF